MQALHGIPVSPGIVVGDALIVSDEGLRGPPRSIDPDAIEDELSRFRDAIQAAVAEIERNWAEAKRRLGEHSASIFRAHQEMLKDPALYRSVEQLIRQQHLSAETAASRVLDRYARIFQNLEDDYLGERASDIFDIEKRLLGHLLGEASERLARIREPVVVLAHDLTPSETASFDRRYVRGLVTEVGGATSHTAIIAQALGIPAVVGVGSFLSDLSGGESVIIDGDHGQVIIKPDRETLVRFRSQAETIRSRTRQLETLKELPAETLDGVRVGMYNNIESPGEVAACLASGSDGVGLYRTEFLYLGRMTAPDEETQLTAYRQVLAAMGDRPVVFRTLDLGSDKVARLIHRPAGERERNPALGLRSVRLSLRHRSLFRTQLRALLRAAVTGDARIMFPMVSTLDELRRARMVLKDVAEDLEDEGIEHNANIPIGVMIEVPSVALLADRFANEVDFFSVGTNDLIQYTLAVDRNNTQVAELYNPCDPALLRLLDWTMRAIEPSNRSLSVCGQMAGTPMYTPLLLGLGIRHLSVSPSVLAEIKQVVRRLTLPRCQEIAKRALELDDSRSITRYLQEQLSQIVPEEAPGV